MDGVMSYEAHRAAASHHANEMARLFILGHNTVQTAQYEAHREDYLQALTDAALSQVFDPPTSRPHTVIG